MSSVAPGAVTGAAFGVGVVLVVAFGAARRRPSLEQRVAPYLGRSSLDASRGGGTVAAAELHLVRLLQPAWRSAAVRLDGVLGGATSLRRRLAMAGGGTTLEQFRLEQLAWGGAAFTASLVGLLALIAGGSAFPAPAALLLCACAGVCGVLAREQLLNRRVSQRAERIAGEFPTVAELLALAVAAGEGAQGAIARVTRACSGDLAVELGRVLDDTRTGSGFTEALRALSDRVGVPSVSRFVDGVVIAIDRGTPLADVLRAQATDARDVRRRQLMETAGRREVAMLVPVVFLILPITVVFALFPGFYGLNLSVN